MTAIICVFYTVGQHHNHESVARRAAIISLIKTFTIDLLDTVDILEVLFETAEGHEVSLNWDGMGQIHFLSIQIWVQVVTCSSVHGAIFYNKTKIMINRNSNELWIVKRIS